MSNIEKLSTIEKICLCKINKEIIGEIPIEFLNSKRVEGIEVSEISLTIPKFITDSITKQKKPYILYKEFICKRKILTDDNDYYVIDEVQEDRKKTYKTVKAYRYQFVLSKIPFELENVGLQLMTADIENDIYSFNDILKELTGWQLGHIDDSILYSDVENKVERLRMIESIDTDFLDYIRNTLYEQYEAVAFFNTINKTIDLIALDNFGEEIKICLSSNNYLKDYPTTFNSSDLITRLKLRGNEELDIISSTATGYDFIDNYSYFIETGEMSLELINALELYKQMIIERTSDWKEATEQKVVKQSELSLKQNDWQISVAKINTLKKQIDILKMENKETELSEEIVNKQLELSKEIDKETLLRLQMEDLDEAINLLQDVINNINSLCKYETCTDSEGNLIFNQELLDELMEFTFEDTFSDDSFVSEEDLIEVGERKLELRCRPSITYSIDSVDFTSRIIDNNFRQHWKGDLSYGDIIVLVDEDGKEEFVYFLGYEKDYKNKNLSIILSNKKINKDKTRVIRDLLKNSKKLDRLMMNNKYVIGKVKYNRINLNRDEIR